MVFPKGVNWENRSNGSCPPIEWRGLPLLIPETVRGGGSEAVGGGSCLPALTTVLQQAAGTEESVAGRGFAWLHALHHLELLAADVQAVPAVGDGEGGE